MNDVLIFLSFTAFVLSPCFIAFRSRDGREEAKLAPRPVPKRSLKASNGTRKKLIVDGLAAQRVAVPRETARDTRREANVRHIGPRSSYTPAGSAAPSRRKSDSSVFIPPARQIPALGYTVAPVPALVYGVPNAAPEDLVCLLVLPGARAQRPSHAY